MSTVVRWLFAPLAAHPEVHDELIATVIQRRPAVYISAAAVMVMSASAAVLTKQPWAIGWLAVDAALTSYRLHLSFRYDDGIHDPSQGRGAVLASMFALFILFGVGCALCIASGQPVLMLMAVISVLGVFAGIGSRWAAFPRLALTTIAAIALPVCLAITARADGGLGLAAVQFAVIAVTTASQTVQNHRTLMRMILAEHQNALLARRDPLTGLGNRVRLREDLESHLLQVAAGLADHRRTAVLYLDLDGFKAFNDSHGHDAGDELLDKVGQAIRLEADGAGVYRIGGDEFIVVASEQDEAVTVQLARRIVRRITATRLYQRGDRSGVGVSIGVAFANRTDSADAILARADEALYAAKRAGKARCIVAERDAAVTPIAA